mmetsp:Transcript_2679/g.5604  ORF Transcript_2679/g.5604 Transcript_2679/m.5604 type:complete len:215 (-) Transcript_2679:620-1264(-)
MLDVSAKNLLELFEDKCVEQRSIETDSHGKCFPHEGRVDECLCDGRRGGDLIDDGLFDRVPNLRHGNHVRGRIHFKGACGVGSGGGQTLGVGVTDGSTGGQATEFVHEFEDVGRWKVSQVFDVLVEVEFVLSGGNSGNDRVVLDDDTLGLSGTSGGVHDHGSGFRGRRNRGVLLCVTRLNKVFEGDDGESPGKFLWKIDLHILTDQIARVNNSL